MKKAVIEMDKGNIVIELFDKEAPGTVANFEKLITEGFYNGLTFHRVIPGFVAQGGCPDGTGAGGPGYCIPCETAGNPRTHERGSLSMAHRGPNTGGSQFFIVYEPQPHLNGVHTVFGQVIEGLDVVDQIQPGDVMNKVSILAEAKKKAAPKAPKAAKEGKEEIKETTTPKASKEAKKETIKDVLKEAKKKSRSSKKK